VARKDFTIRLCAETMLQLKPQTKSSHWAHALCLPLCQYWNFLQSLSSSVFPYNTHSRRHLSKFSYVNSSLSDAEHWKLSAFCRNSKPSHAWLSCELTSMNSQNHMLHTVVIRCWLSFCALISSFCQLTTML
jgi:hypothetical protein